MAPSTQSNIQSFYQRETPSARARAELQSSSSSSGNAKAKPIRPGDGFTEAELADATDPMTRKWNPTSEYEERDITQLERGPKAVLIVGRVVNFSEILGNAPNHPKARGWHNMLVRDDTGVLQVRLYFSHKSYPLKIGQLISIWTAFVSDAIAINSIIKVPNAPLATSIFPGRDTSAHLMAHLKSDSGDSIKVPLECQGNSALPGLMTLKNFIEGGHEVENCKILVCVKSVGPRKTITLKNGNTNDLVEIHIYDDTATNKLCLWGVLTDTGKEWIPNTTILLISNPSYRLDGRGNGWGNVSLTGASMIDVNPRFRDADWLRNYVVNLYKRESLRQDFPSGVWDLKRTVGASVRVVYSLADIDSVIRENPSQIRTGYTTLTLLTTHLSLLRSRNMLLCTDHCGIPIYTNAPLPTTSSKFTITSSSSLSGLTTTCKNCNKTVQLSLNPKVIGALVDETGHVSAGRLLWSEGALEELLGMGVREVVGMGAGELRLLEQRMVGLRFTFVWGWSEAVGKLAILAVRE